ncbi:MAG: RsmB/NOP family class I SAM-dependent RNA methyltransferase [Myxococcota bacterium]
MAISASALVVAVDALRAARADWRHAEGAVSRVLRAARSLPSRERRAAGEAAWGVVRGWRAVELCAGASASDEARVRVWAVMDGAALEERLRAIGDPVERAAVRHSFPNWLFTRIVAEIGLVEAEAFAAACAKRPPMTVRTNAARISRDALRERLATEGVASTPTPLTPDGLRLDGHPNLRALACWKEGLLEAQDEGSQLVASMVDAPGGGLVVDACAGAGGKTLALAARARGGRVVALDVDARRIAELRERARRAGASAIETALVAADAPAPARLRDAADRVLIDAPCSGTGVLRRHPALRFALVEAEVDALPARQVELCVRFAACVRPGGRLIYATCSVLRSENEEVVAMTLRKRPELRLVETRRLWPQRDETDGFFVGVLERAGAPATSSTPP